MPILSQLNGSAAANDAIVKVQVGFAGNGGAILVVGSDGQMTFDRQPMTGSA